MKLDAINLSLHEEIPQARRCCHTSTQQDSGHKRFIVLVVLPGRNKAVPDITEVLDDCSALHGCAALLGHTVIPLHVDSHPHALHALPQPVVQCLHCTQRALHHFRIKVSNFAEYFFSG